MKKTIQPQKTQHFYSKTEANRIANTKMKMRVDTELGAMETEQGISLSRREIWDEYTRTKKQRIDQYWNEQNGIKAM